MSMNASASARSPLLAPYNATKTTLSSTKSTIYYRSPLQEPNMNGWLSTYSPFRKANVPSAASVFQQTLLACSLDMQVASDSAVQLGMSVFCVID